MSSPSSACPRCHKFVSPEAIACPHCRTPLKALGHVGIPLHQADIGKVLCDTCLYHHDDSCNYPQRPTATNCIMYVDQHQPPELFTEARTRPSGSFPTRIWKWLGRHLALVIVLGMVVISLWVALSGG